MAADVRVHRLYGSGPSAVDVTNQTLVFAATDALNPSTPAEALPVPTLSSSYVYSYWIPVRMYAAVAASGSISNLRIMSNGSATPIMSTSDNTSRAYMIAYLCPSYYQPEGTLGVGADYYFSSYHPYPAFRASVNGLLSTSSPGTQIYINGSGSGVHSGTGYFGEYIHLQLRIGYLGTAGWSNKDIIIYTYDET